MTGQVVAMVLVLVVGTPVLAWALDREINGASVAVEWDSDAPLLWDGDQA